MFGLIKLIIGLLLLTGIAVYGGDIWNTVKEKMVEFTNPEVQKATIFRSFKDDFGKVEKIIKEVKDNIGNPNFDTRAKLEESLKIIGGSKGNLEKIENSGETLIEKAFEGLRDVKDGVASFFPDSKKEPQGAQDCRCNSDNK